MQKNSQRPTRIELHDLASFSPQACALSTALPLYRRFNPNHDYCVAETGYLADKAGPSAKASAIYLFYLARLLKPAFWTLQDWSNYKKKKLTMSCSHEEKTFSTKLQTLSILSLTLGYFENFNCKKLRPCIPEQYQCFLHPQIWCY